MKTAFEYFMTIVALIAVEVEIILIANAWFGFIGVMIVLFYELALTYPIIQKINGCFGIYYEEEA